MLAPRDGRSTVIFDNEAECLIAGLDQRIGAALKLIAEAALRGCEKEALVGKPGRWIDPKIEAGQMADRLGSNAHLAIGRNGYRKGIRSARADISNQHCRPAIDEALGKPLV
jgi:hypothetical protein